MNGSGDWNICLIFVRANIHDPIKDSGVSVQIIGKRDGAIIARIDARGIGLQVKIAGKVNKDRRIRYIAGSGVDRSGTAVIQRHAGVTIRVPPSRSVIIDDAIVRSAWGIDASVLYSGIIVYDGAVVNDASVGATTILRRTVADHETVGQIGFISSPSGNVPKIICEDAVAQDAKTGSTAENRIVVV